MIRNFESYVWSSAKTRKPCRSRKILKEYIQLQKFSSTPSTTDLQTFKLLKTLFALNSFTNVLFSMCFRILFINFPLPTFKKILISYYPLGPDPLLPPWVEEAAAPEPGRRWGRLAAGASPSPCAGSGRPAAGACGAGPRGSGRSERAPAAAAGIPALDIVSAHGRVIFSTPRLRLYQDSESKNHSIRKQ